MEEQPTSIRIASEGPEAAPSAGGEVRNTRSMGAWCHGCAKDVTAFYNSDLELECEVCHSTFVESHGQSGLSGYVVPEPSLSSASVEDRGMSAGTEQTTAQEAALATNSNTSTGSDEATTSDESVGTGTNPSALIPPPDLQGNARFSEEEDAILRRILESSESPPAGSRNGGGNQMNRMNLRQRAGGGAGPPDNAFNADAMILSLLSALNGVGDLQPGLQQQMLGGSAGGGGVPQDALADILHHILVNETSVPGAPPASEDAISSIKKVEVTEDNLQDLGGACYISQEPFVVGESVMQLNCGHAFNEEDITKWLKMHNTCPVCREPVSGGDDSGKEKDGGQGRGNS